MPKKCLPCTAALVADMYLTNDQKCRWICDTRNSENRHLKFVDYQLGDFSNLYLGNGCINHQTSNWFLRVPGISIFLVPVQQVISVKLSHLSSQVEVENHGRRRWAPGADRYTWNYDGAPRSMVKIQTSWNPIDLSAIDNKGLQVVFITGSGGGL